MAGLQRGREPSSEGWMYLRSRREPPFGRFVRDRSGKILVIERVGFPFRVRLQHEGSLQDAAAMRVMKAVSFSVRESLRERSRGLPPGIGWIKIDAGMSAGGGIAFKAERRGVEFDVLVDVSPEWIGRHGESAQSLRAALFPLAGELIASLPGGGRGRAGARKMKRRRKARPPAKVLFFGNIFLKDVDRGDSLQVNPGIHYLVSPLVRRGEKILILDGKIPLQDVCERPPDVSAPLSPREFYSRPDELEEVLLGNPDISLVCITLLERCFAQARELLMFIRARSRAFIAAGGIFPTLTPEHAFVHLPVVNFFVRGDGEEALPRIVDAVAGRSVDDGLDEEGIEILGSLRGVVARSGGTIVSSALDEMNRVGDLDRSALDFSLFEKKNVESGISLSTSRGCVYNCRFCSVMDKKVWRGKSRSSVRGHLRDYERRLVEIYGSKEKIMQEARRLQVWDDDFFIDPERAAGILADLKKMGFVVTFLQGTVSSFFARGEGDEINEKLLDSIPREIFTMHGGLKLGTENFCDKELRRIGKPYRYGRIRKLALALGARGLEQEHYLVLCNRETTIENLMENFEKMAELRWLVGDSFRVLEPSWLMNLFPTQLWRTCMVKGMDSIQPGAGRAAVEGYPEFDYPFVIPERPERNEVYEVVRRFPRGMHFGMAGKPAERFDDVYEKGDREYLAIFGYVEKVLRRRRGEIDPSACPEAASELYRIDECLERHYSSSHRVPAGLLARLAPGLAWSPRACGGGEALSCYVRNVFRGAAGESGLDIEVSVEKSAEGVMLEVRDRGGILRFLVQKNSAGSPCAFSTRNLAFIVRSPAGGLERLIEKVRDAATRLDTWDLD